MSRRLTTRQMAEAYVRAALPDPLRPPEDLTRMTRADTSSFVEKYRRKARDGANKAFIINRITGRLWTDPPFFTAVSEFALAARADLLEV